MTPRFFRRTGAALLILTATLLSGCTAGTGDTDGGFSTSGSDAADQRAEQAVRRAKQVAADPDDGQPPHESGAKTLYARLGGDAGLTAIVDDFIDRAIVDPRVNWSRTGIEDGWFTSAPEPWEATPARIAAMKTHIVQFLSLAAGGPAVYRGRPMKESHAGMQITNVQFDAAVGDLQATLDKLGVPDQEQKELLAIIETTREQVVEIR